MKRKTAKLCAALLSAVLILNYGFSPMAVSATTSPEPSSEEELSAANTSETEGISSEDADEAENPTEGTASSVVLTASTEAFGEENASETAEVLVVMYENSMAMTWEDYNNNNYDYSDFTVATALSGTLDMDIIFVGENHVTIEGSLDLGEHKIYGADSAGIYLTGDNASGNSAVVSCGGIEAPNAYLELYVALDSSGDVSVSFMDFRGSYFNVNGSLYGNSDSTAVDENGNSGYIGFWGDADSVNITGDISTDEGIYLYFGNVTATIGGSVSGYSVVFYSNANVTIGGSVLVTSYCHATGNATVIIEGDVSSESLNSNYGSNITVMGDADIVDNIYAENYINEDGSYELTTLTIYGNASVTETKELTEDSEYWGAIVAFEGTQITIGGDAYAVEGFDIYKDATLSIGGSVTTVSLWTDEYGTLIIGGDLTFDEFYTTEYAVIEIGGDLTVSDANEDGWGIAGGVTLTVGGNLTSPNLDVWDYTTVQVGGDVTADEYVHVGDAGALTVGGDVTTENIGTFSTVWDDDGNETDEKITGSSITISGSLTVSNGINVETGTSITVDGDVTVKNGGIEVSDGAVAIINGALNVSDAIYVLDGSLLAIGESSLTEYTGGGTVSINGQTVTTPYLFCAQLHLNDATLTSDVRAVQIYVYSDSVVNGAWEIEEEYLTDPIFCYEGGILCNTTSFNGADCVENSDATWYFYSIDELADILGIEMEASTTYALSCDDPVINDVKIVIDENGSANCTTYLLPENVTLVSSVSNADTDTDPDSSGSDDSSDSGATDSTSSGVSSQEDTGTDSFYETIRSIEKKIATTSAKAISSGTETGIVTIDSEETGIIALPNSIMQYLVKYNNVTLVHNFTYNGKDYSITIPAGGAVDNDIPWYGPLYLIAKYGSNTALSVNTTASAADSTVNTTNIYIVQSGDNLSLIAADFDMTLGELVAKNPQIANLNLIYPGDKIYIE